MGGDMGTIRIPRDDFDRHNENRRELGVTWAEYIDGHAPEYTYAKDIETLGRDELREIVREETRRAVEELGR